MHLHDDLFQFVQPITTTTSISQRFKNQQKSCIFLPSSCFGPHIVLSDLVPVFLRNATLHTSFLDLLQPLLDREVLLVISVEYRTVFPFGVDGLEVKWLELECV